MGITLPLLEQPYNIWVAIAVVLCGWLVFGLAKDFLFRTRSNAGFAVGLKRLTPSYWGMLIAHLGFAAAIIGVVATSQYAIEHDLKMSPGDSEAAQPVTIMS